MDDDVDDHCPLCTNAMTVSELAYAPCKCGYLMCSSCLQILIATTNDSKCPMCRSYYDMEWLTCIRRNVIETWVQSREGDFSKSSHATIVSNILKRRQAEMLFISHHMREKVQEGLEREELEKAVNRPLDEVPIMDFHAIRVYSDTVSEHFRTVRKGSSPLFDMERPRSAPIGKMTAALTATYRENRKAVDSPHLAAVKVVRTRSEGPNTLGTGAKKEVLFTVDLLQHVRAHSDFLDNAAEPRHKRHPTADDVLIGERFHFSLGGRYSLTDDSYLLSTPRLSPSTSELELHPDCHTPRIGAPQRPKRDLPEGTNAADLDVIQGVTLDLSGLQPRGRGMSNVPLTPPHRTAGLVGLDFEMETVDEVSRPELCCVIL